VVVVEAAAIVVQQLAKAHLDPGGSQHQTHWDKMAKTKVATVVVVVQVVVV
jgi:hypothetical protein